MPAGCGVHEGRLTHLLGHREYEGPFGHMVLTSVQDPILCKGWKVSACEENLVLGDARYVSAGYKEAIGPSGQVVVDSLQDSEAAELGMPGEDEATDLPEDDDLARAPETLEELDAQLDEQEQEINAFQVRQGTLCHANRVHQPNASLL